MTHDSEYFRRRPTEAGKAAFHRDDSDSVEVAGYLALAYAALARRRKVNETPEAVDPIVASAADDIPLMLRD